MSVLYAQVIVDIVHENVAHTFTYRIPDGMTLTAGQRVEVPFGRMRKEGVVLSLTQETDVPPESSATSSVRWRIMPLSAPRC